MTLDATTLAATTSPTSVATPAPQADAEDALATAAGDFETFLSLLTTQMRNQDPLKPLDSTEFVAQLASFSAVEQQIRSNDRLDAIFDLLSDGGDTGLAQWIGKEVQAAALARFDGEPLSVETTPVAEAERAVMVVTDADGTEVARINVDPSASLLSWDGATATGEAPEGLYGFKLDYYSEDSHIGEAPGLIRDRVTEIRLGGETPMLRLAGGDEIEAETVLSVREPTEEG
ncbi:flagellar basal-body rod modification protein FlgD [Albimonas donghaensis]|uniref:Basal-body rod modification protein FlgD n=1 Tax=Albimonas donghaensis TaxID=356660 RepID=A0A1H2ZJG2_9RHOB|nr:flagellar hook capping FlgD N-terminal domain-containing protein [Albimonas donghaensis]SDX16904.1 flagellar basal-body rod modification protein FlgD [Albimonas donghaensis]